MQNPPYFTGITKTAKPVTDIANARILGLFGDKITTDHISPAGNIKATSPGGIYLSERQVAQNQQDEIRRLKAELKALNAGPIEFRKCNSTADSEALRGKLKTRGDEPLVVALIRHDARDLAIVCRRIAKGASMG